MTTPSNSPEHPTEDAPPTDQAPQPTEAIPAVPPAGEPFAEPAAGPFAPVARAPRMPWVNPARRGRVAAAAIVGALVFGGGGLLVGHAVTGHGDRHGDRNGGVMRMHLEPGMGGHGFGRGQHPHNRGGPRQQGPNGPVAPTHVPTPAPSGRPTS